MVFSLLLSIRNLPLGIDDQYLVRPESNRCTSTFEQLAIKVLVDDTGMGCLNDWGLGILQADLPVCVGSAVFTPDGPHQS